jgi:hypothetical protein
VQLAFYGLYWAVGTDKATSSFNAFGTGYIYFYYPAVTVVNAAADAVQLGGGLGTAAAIVLFGPLLGIFVYAVVIAFVATFLRSITRRD